jgi:hypothetical protein
VSIHPPVTGAEAADRLAIRPTEAEDGSRTLMVASIRYLDTFVRQDGAWLFAKRRLLVNWTDTRPSVS